MHTPGPWKLCHHLASPQGDKDCPCGYRGGIWGADGEHIVCEIGPTITPGQEGLEGGRYPRDVELANAKVIAAAPVLLDAAEAALGFIGRYHHAKHPRAVLSLKLQAAIFNAKS